jgi:hypothetical protein
MHNAILLRELNQKTLLLAGFFFDGELRFFPIE